MAKESLIPPTERRAETDRRRDPMAATTKSGPAAEMAPETTQAEELNPWITQEARFDFAAQKLSLDDGMWKVLRQPTREIIAHIPVGMDDGTIEVFTGYRVQHSIA